MKRPISFPMNLRYLVVVLFCGAFALFSNSCANKAPEGSRASQAQKGKVHFMEYCAPCHGEDGTGKRIDSLSTRPADLTALMRGRVSQEFPILEIANLIDGRKLSKFHADRDMPIWGDVFAQQEYMSESEIKGKLSELIAYLMSIQG